MFSRLIVYTLILSFSTFINAEELTLEKVKEVSAKATSELESVLKKELKEAKRADGMKGMTDFCINKSYKITEDIDKKYGPKVSVKRISLNNRNEKAKALESEIKILEAFDLIQKSDAYLPDQIVQIVDEKTYKVYSPIEMKSRDCKKCHGLEEKIDKESRDDFTAAYKNNKAYGYKSGEIRGSVVISISK